MPDRNPRTPLIECEKIEAIQELAVAARQEYDLLRRDRRRLASWADSAVWINTDRLSRQAETQIRAQPDRNLVAEYAKAMLGGAVFPPIIVFQDVNDFLHIGDGYHR